MRISDWSSDVVLFRSSAAALGIWRQVAGWPDDPECCLINLYRDGAKMGLHQDRDEAEMAAPVVSISLGDDAVFRLGGTTRGGPARSLKLASGDVLVLGGAARLAFHGISTRESKALSCRSEEHTSELQSLMRISYAVF